MYEIKDGDMIVCKSREESFLLLRIAHEQGYQWNSGNSLLEFSYWNKKYDAVTYAFYEMPTRKVASYAYGSSNYRTKDFSDVIGEVDYTLIMQTVDIMTEVDNLQKTINNIRDTYYKNKYQKDNGEYRRALNTVVELGIALDTYLTKIMGNY